MTARPPGDVGLAADAFADHPSVIIAPPRHPFLAHDRLPPGSIGGEPFIAREAGSGTRQLMDGFFRAAGIAARIAMTSSSDETIKQAITAGMGLALILRHRSGLELHLGLLRILSVEGSPLMRPWPVTHRLGKPLLPIHAKLREFLLERGASVIGELEASYRCRTSERAPPG